ncbi:MAG: hypothetical protein ACI4LO_00370 [Anaerovoracaceae bacterium]
MLPKIKGLVKINDTGRVRRILSKAGLPWKEFAAAFPSEERRKAVAAAVLEEELPFAVKFGGAYSLDRFGGEIIVVISSGYRNSAFLRRIFKEGIFRWFKNPERELSKEEKDKKSRISAEMSKMEAELTFPEKYLYISFMGVRQETKKKEKSSAMLDCVIAYSRQKGLPLAVCVTDTAEVSFFQEKGFKVMGITSSKEFEFIKVYLILQ